MRLNKNIIGLILGPLLFSVILIFVEADGLSIEAKCILASTAWMAVWWVTECVPISVTALLPIVLFPITGGMDLSTTTAAYGHKLVFLFVGGFLIALAIEKWHLHKRLALNIIRVTGSNKSRVILGFMLATAFLSMWISNTATSIMILPVGLAIISQLKDDPNTKENENEIFGKSLMIAIAYSASIGGMATLIGTPPNMVLAGVVEESYGIKLNMFDWMKFGVPLSSFLLIICWFYLTKIAFKFKNEPTTSGKIVLKPSAAFESLSIDEFTYQPLSDFYVELNYKTEIAFQVGVSMDTGNEIIKAPVVTVNPNTEWNKIYINLITELGGTVPDTYKVFIRGLNNTTSNKEVLIDNLKLVY